MTRVCYVSQTRVMLRAIALVIFPSFQSGLHPDDGHALQSSLDLRPQVEGPTLTTMGKGRHLVALRLSQGLGLESSHHLLALTVLMST